MQVFSSDFGARGWEEDGEEDGFDPYWGVLPQDACSGNEDDLTADAGWLAPQLAPLLGHHAPKCGFLSGLADAAGVALESVMRPGDNAPTSCLQGQALWDTQ